MDGETFRTHAMDNGAWFPEKNGLENVAFGPKIDMRR